MFKRHNFNRNSISNSNSAQVQAQTVPMGEAIAAILARQHNELLEALRAQTAAIANLADSNKELVVALAQLALVVEDPEPDGGEGPVTHAGDVPNHAGMGDAVGGYIPQRHGTSTKGG